MAIRKYETQGTILAKEFKAAHKEMTIRGEKIPESPDRFILHILVGEKEQGKSFYEFPPVMLAAEVTLEDFAKVNDATEVALTVRDNGGNSAIICIAGMTVKTKDGEKEERLASLMSAAGLNKLKETMKKGDR